MGTQLNIKSRRQELEIRINRPLFNEIFIDYGGGKEELGELPVELRLNSGGGGAARFRLQGSGKLKVESVTAEGETPEEVLKWLAHECGHLLIARRPPTWVELIWYAIGQLGMDLSMEAIIRVMPIWVPIFFISLAITLFSEAVSPLWAFGLWLFACTVPVLGGVSFLLYYTHPWEREARRITKVLGSDPRWSRVVVIEDDEN